ncbi:cell division protein FtsH, partial [Haemophilus parainfluenzae]
VLVDRPDKIGRKAILAVHVRNVRLGPDVDLDALAARTSGFTGADLANLVNEAALLAARHDRQIVTMVEFGDAFERVIAGLEKKS